MTSTLLPGRRPSNPVASTHLWRGKILTDLPEGEQSIEVKATDMFGNIFLQKRYYRVEAR